MANEQSRRVFLEKFAACIVGGGASSQLLSRHAAARPLESQVSVNAGPYEAQRDDVPWVRPPAIANPNILVIIVDQMRLPVCLSNNQRAKLTQTVLPNIAGRIQANAYNFGQYFAVATDCTPSRATLLTGLYAPQTAMYCTANAGAPQPTPALNTAFPTWGRALPKLNRAYQGNVWWFGKWHVSECHSANPLSAYGFNTRTYPGGSSPYNPSPDGGANEGTGGGLLNGTMWANDSQIADDFTGWLQGLPPSAGQPQTPWCATVSLQNPHDITFAPAWFQSGQFPPPGFPVPPVCFLPPSGSPTSFYQALPSPWNIETAQQLLSKPSLQRTFMAYENRQVGTVSDWKGFLNLYFWLQSFVDIQVGKILDALANSGAASNTIVIFLSDHGEYAGSHGLHTKGWAAYDESIRVPLSVQFPGRTGSVAMNQMCSAVDFFGLICDLGTSGDGRWKHHPDLARRQSLWSFLYNNSGETRVAPAPLNLPYVFHTFDEFGASLQNPLSHIACLRTKNDPNIGVVGAKLAFYSKWASCTTYPDGTSPEREFYDYDPSTTGNTSEMGNDSNNAALQGKIADYTQVLGNWGPPATGLIGSELNAPLTGTGTNGQPLNQALTTAQQTYFDYAYGTGACPV